MPAHPKPPASVLVRLVAYVTPAEAAAVKAAAEAEGRTVGAWARGALVNACPRWYPTEHGRLHRVPVDHPVRPLGRGEPAEDRATCGECGRSWDDAIVTDMTPAPSGRCPFEAYHV